MDVWECVGGVGGCVDKVGGWVNKVGEWVDKVGGCVKHLNIHVIVNALGVAA